MITDSIAKTATNPTRKIEEIFNYLTMGFLRGTIRFSKLENIDHHEKSSIIPNEIRLGVSHVSIYHQPMILFSIVGVI